MKLPVFKAFGATYSFVLNNLFACVQIVWLPLAIMYAAAYWFLKQVLPLIPQLISQIETAKDTGTPESVPYAMLRLFAPIIQYEALLFLLVLVLFAVLSAGLLRFVVRGERPRLPFYLGFGGDELRLIFTWILIVLLFIGFELAAAIAIAILAAVTAMAAKPLAATVAALAVVACLLIGLWLVLRLSLSGAGAIAVRGIGIGPSWRAARGNSLNLLGFWILVFIPLIAIGMVLGGITSSVILPDILGIVQSLRLHEADESARAAGEVVTKLLAALEPKLPALFAVSYVIRLVTYPIVIIAGGIAYRFLTEDETESHGH